MKPYRLIYLSAFVLFMTSCGNPDENHEENHDADSIGTENVDVHIEENLDYDIHLTSIEKNKIPEECDYEGKVFDVNSWSDANGLNYFIRSISEFEEENLEDGAVLVSQNLYAYHYIQKGNTFELKREVTDFVKDCEFDVIVSHVPTAIELKDINKDNIGEISFVYRLACTSDVSSSNQKLVMLENGEKYILRGYTEVYGEGGDFEIGEEFNNAPEGFLEQAKKMWEEHRTEYDFEL